MRDIPLDSIKSPADIKNLSQAELERLAIQIREKLIQIAEQCGGHLASNLGVVELTLALHAVFDSPTDKIVWDVSHQAYVHKMLTGRLSDILSIRKFGGLSGFTKISESPHDSFGAGHASTSISAALGMAHARDLKKENHAVVAVVGDGSLSGGMIYEALNNAEHLKSNFICILNDNNMSISHPIGSMAKYITQLRTSNTYNQAKEKFEHIFDKIPRIGVPLKRKIERTVERIRDIVIDFKFGVLFEEFGFRYLGPLDGHNLPLLMAALKYAKNYQGPIMIHVLTQKGKGYPQAEQDPISYHGVSPKPSGASLGKTFTKIFGEEMVALGKENPNFAVITPAMMKGSGLDEFAKEFPARFFDVGIAEEHAVTFCAGLASAGVRPVLAIYSTFLQRGYDQVIHDVCLQNLPVIFAIDRAGLVGEDGPTHHGVFDVSFLLHIPNMMILSPKDGTELRQLLRWAFTKNKPIAIRYPKDPSPTDDEFEKQEIMEPEDQIKPKILFSSQTTKNTKEILLISYGHTSFAAYQAAKIITKENMPISIKVLHVPMLKPLDIKTIRSYIQKADKIMVIEESSKIGGFYSYILQNSDIEKDTSCFYQIALPDEFIEHGSNEILREKYGLSPEKIASRIKELAH